MFNVELNCKRKNTPTISCPSFKHSTLPYSLLHDLPSQKLSKALITPPYILRNILKLCPFYRLPSFGLCYLIVLTLLIFSNNRV